MKKNIFLILICLLLLGIIFVVVYFIPSKSTPKSNPSTAGRTSNIIAKISNISGNTIMVEQILTDIAPTSTSLKVTADTLITFTRNTNFFLPKPNASEKLTLADLKTGYLASINATQDQTATNIDIFDVSNTLTGMILSLSGNTMELNILSPSKDGRSEMQSKTYTVTITPSTEFVKFNKGQETPIKLSEIKETDNLAILADPNTDVTKTDSVNAIKIVLLPSFLPPATVITP